MTEEKDNLKLIKLLENEMLDDISKINIDIEDEDSITLEVIYSWYIESEKLIRVFANILSVPMAQAINQLRYAGHHILKSQIFERGRQQNLIEGYKHCKRSVYDALDFYVYTLNRRYMNLLPLLKEVDAHDVETLLKQHILEINEYRIKSSQRIEYYSNIQTTLTKGLDLIEKLNQIQRASGVADELLTEKRQLIEQLAICNLATKGEKQVA